MQSYGAKATFFITGNNNGKGKINDPSTIYPAIIKV
jgi:peptidoglycan/xylan/chitin deacetylase (PgdA/CDA1 family)